MLQITKKIKKQIQENKVKNSRRNSKKIGVSFIFIQKNLLKKIDNGIINAKYQI